MNYKVVNLKDDTYTVYAYPDDAEFEEWTSLFQGSISDCEAFIRLREQGLM